MSEQLTFDAPEKREGKLIFSLKVPVRLPSWNEVLGMEHWARYKLKQDLAKSFELSLRATARDFSMKTTSAKNIWLTYVATLELYQRTRLEQRRLRLSRKKSKATKRKNALSKYTNFDDVSNLGWKAHHFNQSVQTNNERTEA